VYFDINTGLTKRIYDYFMSTSTKKFIFFSSVKAVELKSGDRIYLIASHKNEGKIAGYGYPANAGR